jgi:hypothetical protein
MVANARVCKNLKAVKGWDVKIGTGKTYNPVLATAPSKVVTVEINSSKKSKITCQMQVSGGI